MSRKSVLILCTLVALGVAGAFGWRSLQAQETTAAVTTAPVTRGTVVQSVLSTGMIEAQQLVNVGARVSGQIETLAVSLGDRVSAGDLIAQIDSQDQQNEVLQAEAALANIHAQIAAKTASLQKAELALSRYEKLGKQNLSSQETVESAAADVEVFKADLTALDAQEASARVTVSAAKIALARTRVTAPIDGTVVAIVVKQGQTVNALQEAPTIVKLAQLDKMLVKVEISEADVVRVAPGQNASFTILGEPQTTFRAVVKGIEPAPSGITESDTISSTEAVYYNGLLEVDNPDGKLRIGMTAQVSIELGKAEDVLTIPFAAIRTAGGAASVQVQDPRTGTLRTQEVTVGLTDKVRAEITSGLAEGDRVVSATASPSGSTGGRFRPPMGF